MLDNLRQLEEKCWIKKNEVEVDIIANFQWLKEAKLDFDKAVKSRAELEQQIAVLRGRVLDLEEEMKSGEEKTKMMAAELETLQPKMKDVETSKMVAEIEFHEAQCKFIKLRLSANESSNASDAEETARIYTELSDAEGKVQTSKVELDRIVAELQIMLNHQSTLMHQQEEREQSRLASAQNLINLREQLDTLCPKVSSSPSGSYVERIHRLKLKNRKKILKYEVLDERHTKVVQLRSLGERRRKVKNWLDAVNGDEDCAEEEESPRRTVPFWGIKSNPLPLKRRAEALTGGSAKKRKPSVYDWDVEGEISLEMPNLLDTTDSLQQSSFTTPSKDDQRPPPELRGLRPPSSLKLKLKKNRATEGWTAGSSTPSPVQLFSPMPDWPTLPPNIAESPPKSGTSADDESSP